jgi:hypothetical protein
MAGALGALAALVQAADAEAADSIELSSGYRFSGGMRERKAIDRAIEDVVADMSFVTRPIARRRLKAAARVAERVRIDVDDDAITTELDGEVYTAPADGKPIRVADSDGDKVELRMRATKSALEQRFSSDDGGKDNTFRLVGGTKMRLVVRIHSGKLPKDLEYELSYRRK